MSQKEYRKLPGSGRRGGFLTVAFIQARSTLWLGKDHLLAVDRHGQQEHYKRYYYRDIQAVITRRTRSASAQNAALFIVLVLFVSLIFVTGPNGRILMSVLAGSTLGFLGINFLRGPTCVCHLITAVHTEELPSLGRLKQARKVIDRLRQPVEAAQGAVTPEMLAVAAAAPPPIEATRPVGPARRRGHRPIRHDTGTVHAALFTALFVLGLWRGMELFYRTLPGVIVGLLLNTALTGLTIWALVRQADSDLPAGVRRAAITSFGNIFLSGLIGASTMIVWMVGHTTKQPVDQFQVFRIFADTSPLDSMWLTALYAVTILFTVVLGVVGMWLLQRHRRQPVPPKV
jgi:hypothetical protein